MSLLHGLHERFRRSPWPHRVRRAAAWPSRRAALMATGFGLVVLGWTLFEDPDTRVPWLDAIPRASTAVVATAAALLPALALADACVDDDVPRWRAYATAAVAATLMAFFFQCALDSILPATFGIGVQGWRQRAGSLMEGQVHWIVAIVAFHAGMRNSLETTARIARLQVARARDRRLVMEQQLSVQQARIDPRFLLQAMRRVGQLHDTEPEPATRALDHLVDWLRAAMPRPADPGLSGTGDWQLAARYLELRRALAPARTFDFALEVDPMARDIALPPTLLLPMIQVALGDSSAVATGGRVDVQARADDFGSRVTVTAREASPPEPGWRDVRVASLRTRAIALLGEHAGLREERAPGACRLSLEWPHDPPDRDPR